MSEPSLISFEMIVYIPVQVGYVSRGDVVEIQNASIIWVRDNAIKYTVMYTPQTTRSVWVLTSSTLGLTNPALRSVARRIVEKFTMLVTSSSRQE